MGVKSSMLMRKAIDDFIREERGGANFTLNSKPQAPYGKKKRKAG